MYQSKQSRSSLYNLEPRALKTGYCESLSSYICRLSQAHSVLVGKLINKAIIPLLNKNYLDKYASLGGNGFYDGAHTINGINNNAESFVKALSQLTTHNQLKHLTLLTWSSVLPVKRLLKNYFSWCPFCFEEWSQYNKPIYTPLMWSLQVITSCSCHQTPLSESCHHCGKQIPVLHRKIVLGYCPSCHKWLGMVNNEKSMNDLQVDDIEWNNWTNKNIGDMIAFSSQSHEIPKAENIKRTINQIISYVSNNNITQFGRLFNIPKATIHGWAKAKTLIPIQKLLMIGYVLNVPIMDILIGNDISQVMISNKKRDYVVQNIANKSQKCSFERQKLELGNIKKSLEKFKLNEEPFSMSEVSRKLEINSRLLYYHFPNLCKEISKRYRDHIAANSLQRKKQLCEEVENAIIKLIDDNIYPSRRKIESYISKNGIIKENIVKIIWKSKLDEYGL